MDLSPTTSEKASSPAPRNSAFKSGVFPVCAHNPSTAVHRAFHRRGRWKRKKGPSPSLRGCIESVSSIALPELVGIFRIQLFNAPVCKLQQGFIFGECLLICIRKIGQQPKCQDYRPDSPKTAPRALQQDSRRPAYWLAWSEPPPRCETAEVFRWRNPCEAGNEATPEKAPPNLPAPSPIGS